MQFKIHIQSDKAKVIDYIGKLPEEKKYLIEIKLKRDRRSIDQNRLYWLWLNCIMDETGNQKDDLHVYFKQRFLGVENRYLFGENIVLEKSTAKLDTKQMTDYLDRVQQFANTELGILLPNPDDLYFQEFYDKYKDFI